MDDNELIIKIRQGDPLAFESLINKYRNAAVLFAYQYLCDFHTAEEIVQDAFVKFYISINDYDPKKASVKTYLYTIIKRKCIDKKRKSKIHITSLEETINISSDSNVEETAITKEQYKIVVKNINKLSKNYKEAIILRNYENMSYEEISKVMSKNLSSVKLYIHRGRKKLLELFRKEYKS